MLRLDILFCLHLLFLYAKMNRFGHPWDTFHLSGNALNPHFISGFKLEIKMVVLVLSGPILCIKDVNVQRAQRIGNIRQ